MTRSSRSAGLALVTMVVLVTMGVVALVVLALGAVALGAEPTTVPVVLEGGDLRSEGQGPGLVGSPLLILVAVAGLGIVTAAVTVLLVRLTRRD